MNTKDCGYQRLRQNFGSAKMLFASVYGELAKNFENYCFQTTDPNVTTPSYEAHSII